MKVKAEKKEKPKYEEGMDKNTLAGAYNTKDMNKNEVEKKDGKGDLEDKSGELERNEGLDKVTHD